MLTYFNSGKIIICTYTCSVLLTVYEEYMISKVYSRISSLLDLLRVKRAINSINKNHPSIFVYTKESFTTTLSGKIILEKN